MTVNDNIQELQPACVTRSKSAKTAMIPGAKNLVGRSNQSWGQPHLSPKVNPETDAKNPAHFKDTVNDFAAELTLFQHSAFTSTIPGSIFAAVQQYDKNIVAIWDTIDARLEFVILDNILYYEITIDSLTRWLVYILSSLLNSVLTLVYHKTGHSSARKLYKIFRLHYSYP